MIKKEHIPYVAGGVAAMVAGGLALSLVNGGTDKVQEADQLPSSDELRSGPKPLRVMVSGAGGQIAYSLLPLIANGYVFGTKQRVFISMLDIPPAMQVLEGVRMELEDGAYPLLAGVSASADPKEALKNADVAVFVGGFPRRQGMLRKDLIEKNCHIFKAQGKALEEVASKSVKVLVVANPANTNCLILKKNAPSIPSENFTCLTRLDSNRAKSQIALKARVNPSDVYNVTIWGNHSATQYPDAMNGYLIRNNVRKTIPEVITDTAWLRGSFISTIQQRGKAIIDARKLSSAMSAANAIGNHLRSWLVTGTKEGETISMGVWSNGNPYGVRDGLIFSFPLEVKTPGRYTIASGFEIDSFANTKIRSSEAELLEELAVAESILRSS